jgi:hypothetical protein
LRSEAGVTGLTRRSFLTASAAALPVLLAACKGVQSLGTPPPPARDIVLLQRAIADERLLAGQYAAAISYLRPRLPATASPAQAALYSGLTAVAAQHAEHLAQLRDRLVEPAGARTSAAASPPVSPAALTGSVSSVVGQLGQAEQAASDRLLGQVTQVPPALAQLFASICASEATHVPFLAAAVRAYDREHS